MNIYLILLFICVFLFMYNYFFYPFLIILISKLRTDKHHSYATKDNALPVVSLIIAAYNEEKVIEDKILNSLKLDYPSELFEIIVVSDGSDDSTNKIVEKFADKKVVSLHQFERKGKSAALNRAVENAQGVILVFSDANNDFSEDAIKHLVKHFNDEKIGAVTGAKKIYESNSREASKGDGLYWKYESAIKKAESQLGSITASEGEILAVRKSMFKPIDPTLINDDAAITFDLVKSGYRVLYEIDAVAYEQASIDLIDDINVKIRMTSGGFQTISREKKFLFPPKNWFAFSFISHKLLRWLAPHLLILIFFLSIISLENTLVKGFLLLQILFYVISLYGWFNRKTSLPGWIYIPMYFTVMNIALLLGFIRYFNKAQGVNWTKAKR
ncbi:MAG: glycosyltransferase family 2 protein [Gammaproteobacteria bacterium]|jgi:poly-beta-1,6-N-acetyl-D-glucosamine synthase|nr:glycosyltransferase family 2 protein [Gammaproteobacteria bacterium]